MSITFGTIGTVATTSTATTAVPYPASTTAGQLAVMILNPKLGPTAALDLSAGGWTNQGFISHGTTGSSNDAGSMRGHVYTRPCDGTEGGTSYTVTWGVTPSAGQAYIFTLNKGASNDWDIAFQGVARTSTSTNWTVTAGADPGITAGDFVFVSSAVPTDLCTASSAGSLSATGLTTPGASTRRRAHNTSSAGSDSAVWGDSFQPTAGTSSGAPTYASTLTGGTNLYGIAMFVRFREVAGAANLVVADGAHAHTADAVTLTQDHVLAVADATHGHTADTVALVQNYTLAIDDASHGHTADVVTLTEAAAPIDLAIDDATHGHAADQVTLAQVHVLVIANATHAHAADNVTLTGGGGAAPGPQVLAGGVWTSVQVIGGGTLTTT